MAPPDLPTDVPSSGDALWVRRVEGAAGAAPVVVGPVVVVQSGDGLLALERDTGDLLWRADDLPPSPSTAELGPFVLVAGGSEVRALRGVDGAEAWRLELPGPVVGPPAVVGPRLVVATRDGAVLSVDGHRGEVRWRAEVGVDVVDPPVTDDRIIGIIGDDDVFRGVRVESGAIAYEAELRAVDGFALSRGELFAATAGRQLVAVDDQGAEQWREDLDAGASAAPVVVGGVVVVATDDGTVRAFARSDGEPLWARTAASAVTAPLLQRREMILVTTPDGWLHRLEASTGARIGSARAGRGALAALNPGPGPAVFTVDASDAVTGLRLG